MPELPEVEVTRQSLLSRTQGARIERLTVREPRLRRPIPPHLPTTLAGQFVLELERRSKYLLFQLNEGILAIHLGMSGSLRWVDPTQTPGRHDHWDLWLEQFQGPRWLLRYTDPRRFGALLWHPRTELEPTPPWLESLGMEPLDPRFDGGYLHGKIRSRNAPIKAVLLDGKVVAGIGNIYACESLFGAGIDPRTRASEVGPLRCDTLVGALQDVLQRAIEAGGSTLRDFSAGSGAAGHFQLQHQVYGRSGLPCLRCGASILRVQQGQRSSWYCSRCQS